MTLAVLGSYPGKAEAAALCCFARAARSAEPPRETFGCVWGILCCSSEMRGHSSVRATGTSRGVSDASLPSAPCPAVRRGGCSCLQPRQRFLRAQLSPRFLSLAYGPAWPPQPRLLRTEVVPQKPTENSRPRGGRISRLSCSPGPCSAFSSPNKRTLHSASSRQQCPRTPRADGAVIGA